MKPLSKPVFLPPLALTAGLAACALRLGLYASAVDVKGLLISGHPLTLSLWALTALVLAAVCAVTVRLEGSADYADNFSPSPAAALGCAAMAAGSLVTVLTGEAGLPGILATVWMAAGILSAAALAVLALLRWNGARPHFALYAVMCLFLALHTVCRYRPWSGNPQLMDYLFALFACIGLMLFAFYQSGFALGMGKRRMQLTVGLLTAFACFACLPMAEHPLLYLGGGLWTLTDLCSLTPVPKQIEEPQPEEPQPESGEE